MLDTIKDSFDFARGKQVSDKKAMAKYIIFLAAFVLEDIGQVLIQELYPHKGNTFQLTKIYVVRSFRSLLIRKQYLYYEQFGTRKSTLSLANAFLMILIAIPNLTMVFKFHLKVQKSVREKFVLILLFGFPTFLLYVLRLYKGPVSILT